MVFKNPPLPVPISLYNYSIAQILYSNIYANIYLQVTDLVMVVTASVAVALAPVLRGSRECGSNAASPCEASSADLVADDVASASMVVVAAVVVVVELLP